MAVRRLGAPEDLETPRPLPARSPVPQRITAVAVTADLSRTAVATAAPWFRELTEVLVLADGVVARLAVPDRREVRDLLFDPGGSALTAMVSGNSICRWPLDGSGERWRLGMAGSGGSLDLPLAQVSVGGPSFATSNAFTRNVVVWDAQTRSVRHDIGKVFKDLDYDDRVEGEGTVALSADGSRLAFCRPRRTFWKEDEGIVVQKVGSGSYAEHRTGIQWANGLAFSPDGAALAVVGARPDQTVATVIDLNDPVGDPEPVVLPTGERVGRINLRPIWCGAEPRVPIVDPDRVTVWNIATASAVLSVDVPGPRIAATLTPDGRTLVIASPDDGVHAHPLP
ncbi:WD40 repeat domain-containing protein [Actinomadura sp. 6N118]|uniref:WD40 repeat domain-containing protein n=1 Tax=Actinomadura sp. 6N118 TaxID=3375151 RepID=UPI0037885B40